MVTAESYPIRQCRCNRRSCEKSISRKTSGSSAEKLISLVLPRDTVKLQHLIIRFPLNCLSSGRLRKVRNKRKIQTFSSKRGRGRLKEVASVSMVRH